MSGPSARRRTWVLAPFALALLGTACGPDQEGAFVALTYNVAGLPEGLSSSHPEANIPQISPKLNAYDLVLVQEDFAYHDQLAAEVRLPYASVPAVPSTRPVADGLNQWSIFPFEPVERVQWEDCHGLLEGASDCLAEKGFTRSRLQLTDGRRPVAITVVNLHAEAGGGPEDQAARAANFRQLARALADEDGAVVVAGDTNLAVDRRPEDAAILAELVQATGLSDACDALGCPEQHIDRVLVRGAEGIELAPVAWARAEGFVTPAGEPLSDHPAIQVELAWSAR